MANNNGGEAHQAARQRHVQSSTPGRFDRGDCTIRWRPPWSLRIRTPREQHLAIGAPQVAKDEAGQLRHVWGRGVGSRTALLARL